MENFTLVFSLAYRQNSLFGINFSILIQYEIVIYYFVFDIEFSVLKILFISANLKYQDPKKGPSS